MSRSPSPHSPVARERERAPVDEDGGDRAGGEDRGAPPPAHSDDRLARRIYGLFSLFDQSIHPVVAC